MGANDRATATSESTSKLQESPLAAVLAGVLGIALILTGITAVFLSQNDVGAAALLAMGALLFLLGAMGDRLASLRYGDLEIVLRRRAEEARKGGDPETAKALQLAADRIGARVKHIGGSYKDVRSSMPAGPQRTARMEQIIRDARADAHDPALDEERVLALLWTGSEGARVWALGVLQERPELASVRSVLESVTRPDQMFDQYQALRLAERYLALPDVRPWSRERIYKAVRLQLDGGALGSDRDSLAAARRIVESAPPPPSASAG